MNDFVVGIIGICLWMLAIGGYIANIVKLVMMVDGGVTAMFIARCVGVFFGPLGIVLGFV